LKSKGEKIL